MRPVSFGVSFGSFGAGAVPAATLLAWAEDVERLGYDVLWFRDHVLWHSPVLDPFTMLGAIAARTSRVRLGPGVLLLPLRSPAIVAKAIASLDVVSSGRAVLGVGVGGEFAKEYEACGVPLRERGRRADESLEAIRALWTSPSASYYGDFVRFHGASMRPLPVQAHVPIWVGGRSDAALRRAARFGDGWLAYFVTPERLAASVEKILAERTAGSADRFGVGLVLYVCLARNRDEARREAAEYLAREYRQPFDHLVDRYCALGSAGECIETIKRFVEVGVDHVTLIPTVPPERFVDDLRHLADDIVPFFRGERA